ncbi:DUF6924 domain-containing protein [Streptomyces huiliensis]|uniref:DUF6924 domain-containing protein n=1 Tax=Streptomyces huiliensis TaxID=2876027 RepID=UPI001CBAC068|nr:hypothetical protein [Streptomyces huiliensis]MBZ4318947.1 hypothetical protein [Streptomyces huiliensis]
MDHARRPIRLPRVDVAPVLRTDFTDPAGWDRLAEALETPVAFEEGSEDVADYDHAVAYVLPVDQEEYRGLLPEEVLAAAPGTGHDLPYDHLYLADAETFAAPDLPLLGIDLHVADAGDGPSPREEPFRVPALQVAGVEMNDSIANLFFREFSGADWSECEVHAAGPGTAVYEEFRQMDLGDEGAG